jgi:hypothetical protein
VGGGSPSLKSPARCFLGIFRYLERGGGTVSRLASQGARSAAVCAPAYASSWQGIDPGLLTTAKVGIRSNTSTGSQATSRASEVEASPAEAAAASPQASPERRREH